MSQSVIRILVALAARSRTALAILKEFAPYAAIELILPGGTIIAILCWLYRRRRLAAASLTQESLDSLATEGSCSGP